MLDDRVIVITGAGRGLGQAFAVAVAEAGGRVVVNDVDDDAASETVELITRGGGAAVAHVGDVTDWSAAAALVDAARDRFGRIDGLINNAAVFSRALPWDETEAEARRMTSINVLGPMFCGIHAMRAMTAGGGGAILNVTSESFLGRPDLATYGATKGAVASLTYAWASAGAEYGIHVNAIMPRAQTRLTPLDAQGRPLPRPAPASVAPLVVVLMSEGAAGLNGRIVRFDGTRLSEVVPSAEMEPLDVRAQGWAPDELRDVLASIADHPATP